MPSLVIPNTVQVTLNWTLGGTPWAANVLHYINDLSTPVNQALADALHAKVTAALTSSSIRPQWGTNWSFASVSVRDLDVANQPMYTSTGSPVAGTAATETMPAQNCVVVTVRTALAGKSYRGRVYLSGWAEVANLNSGLIATPARTAAQAFVAALDELEDLGFPYSLKLGVASRTLEVTTPATGYVVRDAVWDAQRRRRDGIVST